MADLKHNMKQDRTGARDMSEDTLRDIADRVASRIELRLETFIAGQKQICAAHRKTTDEHHYTLFGNGTPGLKTRQERQDVKMNLIAFLSGGTFLAVVAAVIERLT
uniref:Uncharacterized protein n=1 Tax=viral metagenome TaxID=1070528 RepID=A0A6M3LC49_9ZZZZ